MNQESRKGSAISSVLSWSHQSDDVRKSSIKPTWKRYIILLLFGINLGNKAFQWVQIPASTAKLTFLYGVDNYVINTLAAMFMLSFLLLSLPACYLIKKIGLRYTFLLASFGTALGAIIKSCSCHEGGMGLLFLGSIIISLSEQLLFSVPSRLASVWFPDHEVSSAVSMCLFGNQIGQALGFIVPQTLLDSAQTKEEIGASLYEQFFWLSALSIIILIAGIFLFDEAPKNAPGTARLRQIDQEKVDRETQGFWREMGQLWSQTRELVKNRDYNLLTLYYSIMCGAFWALSTVLNQMLDSIWPGDDILIGQTGSIMVIAGVISLPLWGKVMDLTHRYLWINMFLTLATTLSFVLFGYAVSYTHSAYAIYAGSLLIGFFVTGILAAGLEFAVELTYPAPEMVTTSVMNVPPQIAAIILIYLASFIVDSYGALACNIFFVVVCASALLVLPFIRETLKRQDTVNQKMNSKKTDKLQAAKC